MGFTAIHVNNFEEFMAVQSHQPGPRSFLKADIDGKRPLEWVDSYAFGVNPGFRKPVDPFPEKMVIFHASGPLIRE
jgi:hypothetical protein